MPPHLHPRSRLTSSLFATTLFASFFVVALPHVLPCPAPRVLYADDGTMIKRRKRRIYPDETTGSFVEGDTDELNPEMPGKRACPIPKPQSIFGQILGFICGGGRSSSDGKGTRPP